MWRKENKWKVLAPVFVIAVLAAAYWYGGSAPGLQGWTVDRNQSAASKPNPSEESTPAQQASGTPGQSASPEPEQPGEPVEETPAGSPDPKPSEPSEPAETEEPSSSPDPAESAGPTSSPDQTPGPIESEAQPEPSESPESSPSPVVSEQPPEPPEQEEPPQPSPDIGLADRPGGLEGGMTAEEKIAAAAAMAGGSSAGVMAGDLEYSQAQGMVIDPATGKDQYLTGPVPEGKPLPVEPQNVEISDKTFTCTLSISCATILRHIDWLDPEKVELVPADGWILPPTVVIFYEGESVFNVLQRTCKQNRIHMEFSNTPMYNSAYIEGIHNLYEFDCGELSGWMYKVNEWFPNYGCSRYQLKAGDVICWEYTCDLGVDVGGFYSIGG